MHYCLAFPVEAPYYLLSSKEYVSSTFSNSELTHFVTGHVHQLL